MTIETSIMDSKLSKTFVECKAAITSPNMDQVYGVAKMTIL